MTLDFFFLVSRSLFHLLYFAVLLFYYIMGTIDNDAEKEHVLEEFRNAWRQEVKRKHTHDTEPRASSSKDKQTLQHKKSEEESVVDLIEQTESLTTKEKAVPVTAMDHYIIAVDDERQGKLGRGMNCPTQKKKKKKSFQQANESF